MGRQGKIIQTKALMLIDMLYEIWLVIIFLLTKTFANKVENLPQIFHKSVATLKKLT